MKCHFCDNPASLLSDGENCDRPICRLHARQLSFCLICRGYGGDTVDVCPDCEASKNHWQLRIGAIDKR
ncbi:hypothetical protein NG799_26375 [Laspinema sp. D1]|uniref:Uncharacterized protein n=1 Tax=Laspinema palackyanum D2a TaxID=2953684 RepID=A0ABT2N293_9CYAN|nr:hypothetical protein [Laspinema sp. D2a]